MAFVYGSGTITQAEYQAATSSIWYNPCSLTDGRGNLTPEANIAVLRGARYDNNGPIFPRDMFITDKAMRDLAKYLGFTNVNDYNSALLTEGTLIFSRAPSDTTPIPVTSHYPFPVIVQGGIKKQLSDTPEGESKGISGKRRRPQPDFFDETYFYEGELHVGAVDNFGNLGGDFTGRRGWRRSE